MIEFSHQPVWSWFPAGLVVLLWFFWSYRTAITRPRGSAVIGLIVIRVLVIAVVLLCWSEPQHVEILRHQQRGRFAVLLDSSRSMSIRDLPNERLAAARSWLTTHFDPVVPAEMQLARFTFDQGLRSVGSFDSLSPTGKVTGIADALEHLANFEATPAVSDAVQGDEAPPTLAGVLLCSDGNENVRKDTLAVARGYRRRGIPIHTLTTGTTAAARDIAIENVQVRRAVSAGTPTHAGVTLRSAGYAGVSVPVRVTLGGEVLASQEIVLGRGVQQIELEFLPRGKGFQILEVSVAGQEGEWLVTNNRRRFGLEVRDNTIQVIYMEGSPLQASKSEWKYLKEALESDPNIKVSAMYRPQFRGGQSVMTVDTDPSSGDTAYHVQHPTKGFPRNLAKLLEYDVVINSDIYKEAFTQEQLEATVRLVEEFGGGFVMIGGNTAFGGGGYHQTVIDKLLPVAIETEYDLMYNQTRAAFPPGALQHPLMAIGSSPEETAEIWMRKFPLLYGYNRVDRAKPGAVVLMTDAVERNRYGPRILIAAQEIGKGRAMAFTSDTTRSWGQDFETIWGERIRENGALTERNCDSRYYRRFWINAIRWLAAGRLNKTNAPVTLELAQCVCHPDEPVGATVKLVDQNQNVVPNASVTLEIGAPGNTNQTVVARYDPSASAYRAEVRPSRAGDYTVTARARGVADADRQLLFCEDTERELENPQANPDLMGNIARASGGKVLHMDRAGENELKTILNCLPPVTIERRRTPLLDRAWLLGALIVLLAAEWLFRRLKGLS